MSTTKKATGVLAVAAAGIAVGRAVSARRRAAGSSGWPTIRGSGDDPGRRWHAVTINRPQDDVAPGGQLPQPLADLGDAVEVRFVPAPGGRGTELHARLRESEPSGLAGVKARFSGDDPVRQLRLALREAKQLAETGEILSPDKPSTTRKTLLNRPLEYATTHGRDEGLV